MATPETQVKNQILKALAQQGLYANKNYANGHQDKGIPDIVGVCHGRFFGLELKRPTGGKPTPVQIENLYQIAANGGLALLTNSADVVAYLEQVTQTGTSNYPCHEVAVSGTIEQTMIQPKVAAAIWRDRPADCHIVRIKAID